MKNSEQPLAVFIGSATLDTIASVRDFPAADSRTIASDLVMAGGGPAATAAVAAARLGARTAYVGAVGIDDIGEKILDGLREEGVDVSGVIRVDDKPSGSSVVIVDESQATRAIVTRPVPPLELAGNSRALAIIESADWVHLDHLGWPALTALNLVSSKFKTSVDAGNPIPGFTPEGVHLYVPTIESLMRDYGHDGKGIEAEALEMSLLFKARAHGAVDVVATHGKHGSWALGKDAQHPTRLPAAQGNIYSTLGAGDVFHGALLAAVMADYPLLDAVETANAVAAKSCEGLDGRSAIPHLDLGQQKSAAAAAPALS